MDSDAMPFQDLIAEPGALLAPVEAIEKTDLRDLIVLFTDGLFEIDGPDDEEFGTDRLLQSVSRSLEKPSAEIVNNLFAEIDRFSAGRGFTDDVCLVGLELLNGKH